MTRTSRCAAARRRPRRSESRPLGNGACAHTRARAVTQALTTILPPRPPLGDVDTEACEEVSMADIDMEQEMKRQRERQVCSSSSWRATPSATQQQAPTRASDGGGRRRRAAAPCPVRSAVSGGLEASIITRFGATNRPRMLR